MIPGLPGLSLSSNKRTRGDLQDPRGYDPVDGPTVNVVAIAILIVCVGAGAALASVGDSPAAGIVMCLLGGVLMQSPRIASQWERAVILRLGKFTGLRGPGLFWIVPFVDTVSSRVDQRTITTSFAAEQTLTSDTVPVNVDAVLFWLVHDVEKAALEVQDYFQAVSWAARDRARHRGRHEHEREDDAAGHAAAAGGIPSSEHDGGRCPTSLISPTHPTRLTRPRRGRRSGDGSGGRPARQREREQRRGVAVRAAPRLRQQPPGTALALQRRRGTAWRHIGLGCAPVFVLHLRRAEAVL